MYQGQATTFLCHVRIHRKLWTQAEPSKTPLHKMSLWHSGCPLKSPLNTSMSLLLQLRFPFPPRTQDCPLHINPWLSRKHPPHSRPHLPTPGSPMPGYLGCLCTQPQRLVKRVGEKGHNLSAGLPAFVGFRQTLSVILGQLWCLIGGCVWIRRRDPNTIFFFPSAK